PHRRGPSCRRRGRYRRGGGGHDPAGRRAQAVVRGCRRGVPDWHATGCARRRGPQADCSEREGLTCWWAKQGRENNMRIGVMIGAERGDMIRKVRKLLDDIEWAEAAGLDTAWMPQVPNDFDCLTMVALMGTHTSRIELGTAVVPLQAQHPVALAR